MDVRARVIALLVVALAAGSVVLGCGGDDDQKAGHAQGGAQGERQAGKAGESGKSGEDGEAEGIGEAGESDEHEVVNAADKKQIEHVVDQFLAYAGRGDYRGVCSLYSPAGLTNVGGSSGCRSFFKGALGTRSEPTRLTKPHIKFVKGGEGAIVEFEGLGRLMELDQVDGKWFLEEAPGF